MECNGFPDGCYLYFWVRAWKSLHGTTHKERNVWKTIQIIVWNNTQRKECTQNNTNHCTKSTCALGPCVLLYENTTSQIIFSFTHISNEDARKRKRSRMFLNSTFETATKCWAHCPLFEVHGHFALGIQDAHLRDGGHPVCMCLY